MLNNQSTFRGEDQYVGKGYFKVYFSTLDKFRLYELWHLVSQVVQLKKGAFLEVGVWRGGSAALMAYRARTLGVKDTFYLCDTFSGVVNASSKDTHYKSGEHADTSLGLVSKYIQEDFGLDNIRFLEGIFPDQTADMVPEAESFRLCHIDVDVYESAKESFEYVWPRMVPGGIVVFDDYGFMGCDGVTKFVNELKKNPLPDALFFYNVNGHALFVKLGT